MQSGDLLFLLGALGAVNTKNLTALTLCVSAININMVMLLVGNDII